MRGFIIYIQKLGNFGVHDLVWYLINKITVTRAWHVLLINYVVRTVVRAKLWWGLILDLKMRRDRFGPLKS